MMMMLSNSRVLVNNGTTVSSVAKKSTTKVLLTLSSSFSFFVSLLSFVYSTAFIYYWYIVKELLWIISLSFLTEDDISKSKRRTSEEREFALFQRHHNTLLFSPVKAVKGVVWRKDLHRVFHQCLFNIINNIINPLAWERDQSENQDSVSFLFRVLFVTLNFSDETLSN